MDQNRIWQAVVALACEITAWTQMLALPQHAARRATSVRADPNTLHRLLRLLKDRAATPIIDQPERTVTGYADGDP